MNAVIYARYSSDNQRFESIDAQVRAIKSYAEKNGMTIVGTYIDEERSATSDDRPDFQRMMKDVENKQFTAVLVHKLDRFARNRYDSAFYKRHLRNHGVRVYSMLENLDDSPESIILESLLEGMAEYYSRNLAREVMKGLSETAYQCKHTGGIPPLGYSLAADKTYVINEREAEAVRIIFTMYLDGQGYNAIIDRLNAAGHKTKTGRDFGKNSIHDILRNEKYSGVFVFNKTQRKINGKRNGHKVKPDDEVIRVPGGCPEIVPPELFERVKHKMAENKKRAAQYKSKRVYALSGLAVCGKCGSSMAGKHGRMGRNKTDYSYYECIGRKQKRTCTAKPINRDFIEELVIDFLYDNLFSDEAIGVSAIVGCPEPDGLN